MFGDRKYRGAQVFYFQPHVLQEFARQTQETLRIALDPSNNRKAAKIPASVYLMNHITCPAILVECGFLSNPSEEALLRTGHYQIKIAAALAGAYLNHQYRTPPEGAVSDEG
jgi:N-acetylmuramoyl-L-alanine amidase